MIFHELSEFQFVFLVKQFLRQLLVFAALFLNFSFYILKFNYLALDWLVFLLLKLIKDQKFNFEKVFFTFKALLFLHSTLSWTKRIFPTKYSVIRLKRGWITPNPRLSHASS